MNIYAIIVIANMTFWSATVITYRIAYRRGYKAFERTLEEL
jgi:hypothetical protein